MAGGLADTDSGGENLDIESVRLDGGVEVKRTLQNLMLT
jgi:hypothetical protein